MKTLSLRVLHQWLLLAVLLSPSFMSWSQVMIPPAPHPYPLQRQSIEVFDRDGDDYLFDDMIVSNAGVDAGMFRLHFDDLNAGSGFFGPQGAAQRATVIQVFKDLSTLLNGFHNGLFVWPNNCGPNAPFPECRRIDIQITESINDPGNTMTAWGSSLFKTISRPEVNSGVIWQYINTGWDPWHLLPYGLDVTPFTSSPMSAAYEHPRYYHGIMKYNEAHNWHSNLDLMPGTSEIDLYQATLREALRMLGLTSLINEFHRSTITNSSLGIYSHWDLHLETNGVKLIDFTLNGGNCWLPIYNSLTLGANVAGCNGVTFVAPGINETVFTDLTYVAGKSLQHFQCSNPAGWVMTETMQPGQAQRFPRPEEVSALCAIGYDLGGSYGDGLTPTVLFPTSMSGVTHSQQNNQVTYNNVTCSPSSPVAAADDFGPFANLSSPGGGTWDNRGNFSVQRGQSITIPFSDILANDRHGDNIYCTPEIVEGGGTLSMTASDLTYSPDITFTGTAVLRYRASDVNLNRSNTAYIYIRVHDMTCPTTSACNENLVCFGDFQPLTECGDFGWPVGMYGWGINSSTVSGLLGHNTPSLAPGGFDNSCAHGFWNDQPVNHCQSQFTYNEQTPVSVNPSDPQEKWMQVIGTNDRYETLVFPLKRTLNGNCHEISFDFATGCNGTIQVAFLTGAPCFNLLPNPLPLGTQTCSSYMGTSFTVNHIESFTFSDLLGPDPNTPGNFILDWQNISNHSITANVTGSDHIMVYITPNEPGGWAAVEFDNFELTDACANPVTVTATPLNANPCIDDQFQIEYTIVSPTTVAGPLTFNANLFTANGALEVVPNGTFDAQGNATLFGLNSGTNTLTLDLKVTNLATPGMQYCPNLVLPPGLCSSTSTVGCITAGEPTVTIDKFITSSGPYHPGSAISWNIVVSNPSQTHVDDIVIQDIVPNSVTVVNVSGTGGNNLIGVGQTFTSNSFDLNSNSQPVVFTVNGFIDPGFGCGVIENCAQVTEADLWCGPVEDCASVNVTLTGPPLYEPISANDTSCFGACDGSITVDGVHNVFYTIMNPPACYGTPQAVTLDPSLLPGPMTINNLSAGTYTILVQDLNSGCEEMHTITVGEPNEIIASVSVTQPSCPGQATGSITVTASGGAGGFTYQLGGQTPTTNNTFTQLMGNLGYLITVMDADGCTVTVPVNLFDPPSLWTTATVLQHESCGNACDAVIEVNIQGGTAPFTWEILPGNYGPATQTGTANQVGTFTIDQLCDGPQFFRVFDNNGCLLDADFTITGPEPVSVVLTGQHEQCVGTLDGSITATPQGGTGPYTLAWNGPNGFVSNATNLTNLIPGTYCVTVTDANGCTTYQTDCFTVQAAVPWTGGPGVILSPVTCTNECDAVIQFNASGGAPSPGFPAYTYTVLNGPGVNPAQPFSVPFDQLSNACPTPQNLPYTIMVQDANGCTDIFTVDVPNPPVMVINSVTPIDPSCWGVADGGAVLDVAGGEPFENPTNFFFYEFTLDPVNGPWSQAQIDNLQGNGPHTIWVRDSRGCILNTTFTLNEPDPLWFSSLLFNDEICLGGCDGEIQAVAAGGTAPYQYNLNQGPNQGNGTFSNLCPGNYDVWITDANQCVFGQGNVINPGAVHPWPKFGQTGTNDLGEALALLQNEGDDEYYITGWFADEVRFENQNPDNDIILMTSGPGDEDAFVAKYDQCGIVWAYSFGSAVDNDRSNAIELLTSNGQIVIGGQIGSMPTGYLDLNNTTALFPAVSSNNVPQNTGALIGQRGFVLELDPVDGTPNWVWVARNLGAGTSAVTALEQHASGAVAGVDYSNGLVIGLNNNTLPSQGFNDIAVISFTANGNALAWDHFGTEANDGCNAMDDCTVAGGSNHVALTGWLGGSFLTVGGVTSQINQGPPIGEEVLVAIFTVGNTVSNASIKWFGGDGNDRGEDIIGLDAIPGSPSTSFYVTGTYREILAFGNHVHTNIFQGQQAFVAAVDWNMNRNWSQVGGGPGDNDVGSALAQLPSGNVMAAGWVAGNTYQTVPFNFAGGFIPTGGFNHEEMWIMEFDGVSGLPLNAFPIGTNRGPGVTNRIYDIDVASNFLYTCGSFNGAGTAGYNFVGGNQPVGTGATELYLARMDYQGTYQPKLAGVNTPEAIDQRDFTFAVFPNPTLGEFTVKWDNDQAESLEILDLSGRLIHRIDQLPETQMQQLDLRQEAQGIYLIRLITGSGVETQKLVKE